MKRFASFAYFVVNYSHWILSIPLILLQINHRPKLVVAKGWGSTYDRRVREESVT
ncbi:MAG: hypothetical protein HQ559_02010 [Lentisphaerae bacterium]|nr:hypothetical protein [Lentisphaerota bacterium]